ncbi:MAG: 2-C-methyl-D-erythritol 2,4-cyclodiphosphate synthase [Candidatus Omnitrophota bacterium]
MRIGIGYDIHRITEGRKLVLGGVEIPYIKGLEGHSDADVLLHAICDALLGAAGEGDIGRHFSDKDPKYKNISSLLLLERVCEIVADKRFKVHNVDTVLIADEPKIEPFKENMKDKIKEVLKVSKEQINIKATTSEGVGTIGRGEAMAAHAVVLLEEEG